MIVWYSDKFFRISLLLGGQGVNIYLTFLKNLYEFSSPLFTGSCKICQLSVMKNLTNQNWSRGRQRNVNESRYKIITKEYHKATVSFFRFLKEATLSFLTDAVDIFCLLFSQVKLKNPIIHETASLAAFLGVSLDRLINTFYVALNTENRAHT